MSTSISIGAGPIHLLGALGLGAVGKLALALYLATSSRGGYYGGGGHRNRGYYNYNRYGREAPKGDERAMLDNLLQEVFLKDETECGLKLICELAGKTHEELMEDEINILQLIGPSVAPGEGVLPPSGAMMYKAARFYGETSDGSCGTLYSACPHNADGMMQMTRTVLEDENMK